MKKINVLFLFLVGVVVTGWLCSVFVLQHWNPTPPNFDRFQQYQNASGLLPHFYTSLPLSPTEKNNIILQREYGKYKIDVFISTGSAEFTPLQPPTMVYLHSPSDVYPIPQLHDSKAKIQVYATKVGVAPEDQPKIEIKKQSATLFKVTLNHFSLTQEEVFLNILGSGWKSSVLSEQLPNQVVLQISYWPYFLLDKVSLIFKVLILLIVVIGLVTNFVCKFDTRLFQQFFKIKKISKKNFHQLHVVCRKYRFLAFCITVLGVYVFITQDHSIVNSFFLVFTWVVALNGYRSKSNFTFIFPVSFLFLLVPIFYYFGAPPNLIADRVIVLLYIFLVAGLLIKICELISDLSHLNDFRATVKMILSDFRDCVLFIIHTMLISSETSLRFFQRINLISTNYFIVFNNHKIKLLQKGIHHNIVLRVQKSLTIFGLVILLNILGFVRDATHRVIRGNQLLIKMLRSMFWAILKMTVLKVIETIFRLLLSTFIILPFIEFSREIKFYTSYFLFNPYLAFFIHTFIYQIVFIVIFVLLGIHMRKSHYKKPFLLLLFFSFTIVQTSIFQATTHLMNTTPTITAITPSEASLWREIRIYGHHFGEAQYKDSRVILSGVPHRVLKWTDDEIIFMTNPANSKSGNLQITSNDGKESNTVRFTYNNE